MSSSDSKITFNYEYITDQAGVERVKQWILNRKFFVFDLETTGLSPFQHSIVLMQLGDISKQWVIDVRATSVEPLRPFFEDKKWAKIGHNLKFDSKMLKWHYGWQTVNMVDTMLSEQVIRCGLGLKVSLAQVAKHYLKISIDKDKELRTSWEATPVNAFSERQLRYAAGDCIFPHYVAKYQKPLITSRGLGKTVQLERDVLPAIVDMELAGMRLDVPKWIQLYQNAIVARELAIKKLDAAFNANNFMQEDLFSDAELIREINYNSTAQLLAAFNRMGYHVDSTDSNNIALSAILGQFPLDIARALIEYRIYNTRMTRYGMNYIDCIEEATGHLHSEFTQCFTTTGRLSSTNPNVQNVPRNQAYRNCFIPDDGDVFIIYDFKAIEPRILGDMSLDPTYIDAFANDKDIYSIVGSMIYGEEVSKAPGRPAELRVKSKIGVLGTSYGTGKNEFYKRFLLDMNRSEEGFLNETISMFGQEESDTLWEGIFATCPGIRKSLDNSSDLANPVASNRLVYDERIAYGSFEAVRDRIVKNMTDKEGNPRDSRLSIEAVTALAEKRARNRGYVTFSQSMNGRKRYFPADHASWWTEGRNHPIQSTASDIIKRAMARIWVRIREEGHSAHIVNQAHDELIVQCKKEDADEVNVYTKELMEEAGNHFLRVVPCVAEGGIKERWEKD